MSRGAQRGGSVSRRTRAATLRRVLLCVIGILYLLSVPWYRDADAEVRIVFGLPDWVAVALGCYAAAAVLNAAAWLLADVRDEVPGHLPSDDISTEAGLEDGA